MTQPLPILPENWEPTRETLHVYAQGVGAIPRAHGIAHPQWWHISLNVRPDGLTTDAVPLPDGGALLLRMDLRNDEVVLETSHGARRTFSMAGGLTGTEFADQLIAAASEYGLDGDYDRSKFENDERRVYDSADASAFLDALVAVEQVFIEHRNQLPGRVGPIQVWPHGFDIAFEWFGTKVQSHEEGGKIEELPSQLNLGFYPAGEAYFYSNPWPFDGDVLTSRDLPGSAEWHTDGWEGSTLPYSAVAGKPDGREELAVYAKAVFDIAAPTLTAD